MSVRSSTKDQYEPPLGSQNTSSIQIIGSTKPSMMPPTISNIQNIVQRPNIIAQVVQNPPKPQNPLIPTQNQCTSLHYQNTFITLTDLNKATSSIIPTQQESLYQEKLDLIQITVIKKE